MTTTLDTRVVEMQFDNAAFERGVKQTTQSLENLDKVIDNAGKTSGMFSSLFGGLAKGISNLFPTQAITSAVSTVSGAVSSIFSETFNLIGTASKIGIGAITAVGASVTALAATGGMTRALNIEQAKFQLNGLGVAWEDVYDDINYAVEGTAYGLDSAAKAASQLVASGVEVGDSMKTALRGISGVAAMTNREYDEVAHIFTTVAGNGRLMGMQLTQLSSYGLNVAATLGEQLGKTEAEIRDMVSEGKIDFETFAAAMDDAFGEHAKDANNTFTGALNNMKFAIKKIGADFAEPFIENMRPIFNSVRMFINLVRSSLKPVVTEFASIMETVKNTVTGFLDRMTDATTNVDEFGNTIVNAAERTKKHLTNIIENIVGTLKNLFGSFESAFGESFWRSIFGPSYGPEHVLMVIEDISAKVRKFSEESYLSSALSEGIAKPLEEVAKGFKEAYGVVKDFFSLVEDVVFSYKTGENPLDIIPTMTEVEKVTTPITKLHGIFGDITNIITSFGTVMTYVIRVWNAFVKTGLEVSLPIFSAVVLLLGRISDTIAGSFLQLDNAGFFDSLVNGIGRLKELAPTSEQLGKAIDFLSEMFDILAIAITDFLISTTGSGDAFETIKAGVQGFYDLILGKTGSATRAFSGFLDTIKSFMPDSAQITSAIKSIGDAISSIISALGDIISKTNILSKLKEFFSNIKLFDVLSAFNLAGLLSMINMIKTMTDSLGLWVFDKTKNWSTLSFANLMGFGPAVNEIKMAFVELQGALKAQVIMKLGLALLAFAGAMMMLSTIDWDKMPQIAAGLAMFTASMVGIIASLNMLASVTTTTSATGKAFNFFGAFKKGVASSVSGSAKTFNNMAQLALLVASIGLAALLMASAMKKMSSIDPEQFKVAAAGMLVILAAFTSIIAVLGIVNSESRKFNGLGKSAGSLVAIGAAVLLMAASMKLLSSIKLDPNTIIPALSGMLMIVGSLSLIILALSHMPDLETAKLVSASLMFATIGPMFLLMAASMKLLSTMDADSASIAIDSIAAAVIALMGLVVAIGVIPVGNIAAGSLLFTTMSVLLASIAVTFKMLSSIDDAGVSSAVQSILGVFEILGVAVAVLAALNFVKVATVSGSLVLMAASLLLLAPAFKMLSTIPIEGVVSALVAIGGAITILGLAVTIIPTAELLGFAAALLLIGVSVAAVGAGTALAGAGVLMFALAIGELITIIQTVFTTVGNAASEIAKFAQSVGIFIVELIKTIAQQADPLAESGSELILAFIKAMGMRIAELASLGVRMIIAFLDGVRQTIGPIVATGIEIVVQFVAGIASKIGDVIEAAMWTGIMFIKGLADGIRENIQYVFLAMESLIKAIGAALLWGFAEILESNPITAPLAQSIRDGGDELAAASEEASDKIEAAFNERFGDIEARADELPDHVASVIGDESRYVAAGEAIPAGVSEGMDNSSGLLDSSITGVLGTMAEGMAAGTDIFAEDGYLNSQAYIESYSQNSGDIVDAIYNPVQEGVDKVSGIDTYSVGSEGGSNMGSGYYYGLDRWIEPVANKAAEMVRAAKNAANAEMDAASPAKDLIKSGGWFGEGFMIGIERMIDPIAKTATDMASGAKEAVEGVLFSTGNMFDMIDFDANPVISPVLDTSRIQAGLAGMYNMFGDPALAYGGYGLALAQDAMPRIPIQSARSDSRIQNSTTNLYIDGDLLRSDDDIRNLYEQWTLEVNRRIAKR